MWGITRKSLGTSDIEGNGLKNQIMNSCKVRVSNVFGRTEYIHSDSKYYITMPMLTTYQF